MKRTTVELVPSCQVKVISNASYKHYNKTGIVTGFTKNKKMAWVKFEDEEKPVKFYMESLKIIKEETENV